MLPQSQPLCTQVNCSCRPTVQPMFQTSYVGSNYGFSTQTAPISLVDTEINILKSEVLQLKIQLSCLKEIADQQLESIKMIVENISQPQTTSQPQTPQSNSQSLIVKRKPDVIPVEADRKRVRQSVNYNQINSGKNVVEITDEPLNQVDNSDNSDLNLSNLLEKTNEEMFEDGEYCIDKKKINVVASKDDESWIVCVDIITTDKTTKQRVISQKKMGLASDLFDHLFTSSSRLSQYINKHLKKNIHFILTYVPYFNSQRLLLTGKGIEKLVNLLSLKGNSFQPKDIAIWKNMIEELK